MTAEQKQSGEKSKGPEKGGTPSEQAEGDVGGDVCRCKEVSKKTIPQMLKLMLSDLAFWRKAR